jgi:hypothetical protein
MDLRIRFSNDDDTEFCFSHAARRAIFGEQIHTEINELDYFSEPQGKCADCASIAFSMGLYHEKYSDYD